MRSGANRRKGEVPVKKHSRLWLGIAVAALLVAVALGFQRSDLPGLVAGEAASPFDGGRAFRDLEAIVGFGARPAGSDNLASARAYIVEELRRAGLEPQLDRFVAETPLGAVEMANIRARREGSLPETLAVAGHYDTKRFDFSFVGANDGGSSAALVLEMARATAELELDHTLEFIFFDGEEAVVEWTATDSLYGSRYDIDRRYDAGTLRQLAALVLVDMIGDTDLGIARETASTGWINDLVWSVAADLGYSRHFLDRSLAIEDDHLPYLNAGIPAVDLIDFDYPYWHTPGDTLDKTSARSLQVVGDVVYHTLSALDREAR
jgi:glutaminyl-peptide cyclotransferase